MTVLWQSEAALLLLRVYIRIISTLERVVVQVLPRRHPRQAMTFYTLNANHGSHLFFLVLGSTISPVRRRSAVSGRTLVLRLDRSTINTLDRPRHSLGDRQRRHFLNLPRCLVSSVHVESLSFRADIRCLIMIAHTCPTLTNTFRAAPTPRNRSSAMYSAQSSLYSPADWCVLRNTMRNASTDRHDGVSYSTKR